MSTDKKDFSIYLDTNFCRDCIKKTRNGDSLQALTSIRDQKYDCFTSVFSIMELNWIEKEEIYFFKKIRVGWDINAIIRGRYSPDLKSDDLDEAYERTSTFFKTNNFIKFTNMDEKGWELARKVTAESTITTPDIIHLVSAWKANCDYLITNDENFIKEGNRILKLEKVSDKLLLLNSKSFNEELSKVEK